MDINKKIQLMKEGKWKKCQNPNCNMPTAHNIPGSKYCSRKCMDYSFTKTKEFKEKQRRGAKLFHSKNPGYLKKYWTAEMKERQRKLMKEIYSDPKVKLKVLAAQHSSMLNSKTREHISLKNTFDSRKRERKESQLTYKAQKGFSSNGSNEFIIRNEFEKTAMSKLDENPLVIKWNYESLVIPFQKRDRKAWVVIDFDVYYNDGSRKIIEFKPNGIDIDNWGIEKFNAVQKFTQENKCSYEVWTNETFSSSFS